jgi:hypothetical protein
LAASGVNFRQVVTVALVSAAYRASLFTGNGTLERCTWYRGHWTSDRIILRSAIDR